MRFVICPERNDDIVAIWTVATVVALGSVKIKKVAGVDLIDA